MELCPVCREEVASLSTHLETHSKQDIVRALISHNQLIPAYAQSAAPSDNHQAPISIQRTLNNFSIVNNINNPHVIQTGAASTTTGVEGTKVGFSSPTGQPSMMGNLVVCGNVMPVNILAGMTTPILLPQIHGPTLLLNVPNYMHYQGLPPMPGMVVGSSLYNQPLVNNLSSYLVITSPSVSTTTAGMVQATATTSMSSSTTSMSSAPIPTARQETLSQDSGAILETTEQPEDNEIPEDREEDEEDDEEEDDRLDVEFEEEDEVDGAAPPSSCPAPLCPVSPVSGSSCEQEDGARSEIPCKEWMQETCIQQSVISHTPLIKSVSAPAEDADVAPSPPPTARTAHDSGSSHSSSPIFNFPTASLNFQASVVEPAREQPPPTYRGTSSVIVSLNSMSQTSEKSAKKPNNVATTIDNIEALQSALACDNDVQLVVSNDLLDTPEFKALMRSEYSEQDPEDQLFSNYEVRTLSPEEEEPSCSSRGISRDTTMDGFENPEQILSLQYASEDDITLQDLIAVETIDESQMPDDDLSWTGNLSSESFQYISRILGSNCSGKSQSILGCGSCGLQFPDLGDYNAHCEAYCGGKDEQSHTLLKPRSQESEHPPCTVTSKHQTFFTHVKTESSELVKREITEPADMSSTTLSRSRSKMLMDQSPSCLSSSSRMSSAGSISSASGSGEGQESLAMSDKHWKCGQCKAVFGSGPKLLNHLEEFRAAKNKCYCCHLGFKKREDLLEHGRVHHKAEAFTEPSADITQQEQETKPERKVFSMNALGEYMCDMCDRAFKEKERLLKHIMCHVEDKPFECLDCGKRFLKASQLKEHRRRHNLQKSNPCLYCEKSFYAANKLKEHMRVHTGEAPLKCDVCGKGFKRHSNLSEHRRLHDPDRDVKPPKEMFCQDCGKLFTTARDLNWHVEETHNRTPKKCSYCGDVFVHSTSLTRHIRLKHESSFMPANKNVSNYANCPICDLLFFKTSIKKHISVVHQGERRFTCEICKSMFVSKHNLDHHMWQHKNRRLRPFKCNTCNKAYVRESLLKEHLRTHQGIKPYVCNECGVQFTMKTNYKRHVEEHSGARNYACQECNKTFTRSYYLTDHMKVHTGEKPYICGICGKTAATRSNYNSHLKTHVTREPVNSEV